MLLLQRSGDGTGVGGSGSGGDERDERRDSTEPFPALSETISARRDSAEPFPALSETITAPAGGVLGLGGKGDAGMRGADTLGAAVADAGKKVLGVDEGKQAPVPLPLIDFLLFCGFFVSSEHAYSPFKCFRFFFKCLPGTSDDAIFTRSLL